MKVGQKIYLEPIGNAARYSDKIRECTISKIGRKYFEVEELPRDRFFINSMKHDGGQYISRYNCYVSLQEIVNKRKSQELYDELRKYFSSYNNPGLSLEKLKQINNILNTN